MPLDKGSDRETISENIAQLIREGYPRNQAIAIAFSYAGKRRSDTQKSIGLSYIPDERLIKAAAADTSTGGTSKAPLQFPEFDIKKWRSEKKSPPAENRPSAVRPLGEMPDPSKSAHLESLKTVGDKHQKTEDVEFPKLGSPTPGAIGRVSAEERAKYLARPEVKAEKKRLLEQGGKIGHGDWTVADIMRFYEIDPAKPKNKWEKTVADFAKTRTGGGHGKASTKYSDRKKKVEAFLRGTGFARDPKSQAEILAPAVTPGGLTTYRSEDETHPDYDPEKTQLSGRTDQYFGNRQIKRPSSLRGPERKKLQQEFERLGFTDTKGGKNYIARLVDASNKRQTLGQGFGKKTLEYLRNTFPRVGHYINEYQRELQRAGVVPGTTEHKRAKAYSQSGEKVNRPFSFRNLRRYKQPQARNYGQGLEPEAAEFRKRLQKYTSPSTIRLLKRDMPDLFSKPRTAARGVLDVLPWLIGAKWNILPQFAAGVGTYQMGEDLSNKLSEIDNRKIRTLQQEEGFPEMVDRYKKIISEIPKNLFRSVSMMGESSYEFQESCEILDKRFDL